MLLSHSGLFDDQPGHFTWRLLLRLLLVSQLYHPLQVFLLLRDFDLDLCCTPVTSTTTRKGCPLSKYVVMLSVVNQNVLNYKLIVVVVTLPQMVWRAAVLVAVCHTCQ